MSNKRFSTFRRTLLSCTALLLALPGLARAAVTSANFASLPPTTVQNTANATPLVMLLLGKDDSLYKKAYTDLVDLTGNGLPDTTYTNSVKYYGYFNSDMCYTYDSTNGYFTPAVGASNHLCTGSANKYWSGNFLNWATMTRMDVLRKVLYGGYRSTDTASKTILERAYFPTDAHSFAKYYNGSDLGDLTPFNGSATAITICNTTPASSGDSQNVTNPPLMRVAKGDFSKWAANERWQCTWDGEKTSNAVVAHTPNDNDPSKSTDGLTSNGAGPDYNVRVEVCDNNVLNASNCTKYPSGDSKPTGLLQTYGESGKIKFGLMTGSYTKSKSGGVLRKNISDFAGEVNSSTDGTFTNVDGIVSTINALRMHGYNNSDGVYNNDDSCYWGLSSFNEPNCSNWGNPMSEMYLEAIRYFNDQNASSAFNTNDSSYIPGVNGDPGLSTATWTHPLTKDNWCAQCSIIVLNTGPFSYDSDQIDSGFSNLTGVGSNTAEALTDQIGTWENITGNKYFIGNNGTINDGLCTPKTINNLSQALGPCPDAPRLGGSYDMAGIAYWAHTNNVNPYYTGSTSHSQTVTTYAVSLSSTTPVVNIPVPGSTTQSVKLMPACRDTWNSNSQTPGDCRIVDMQITTPYTLSGGTATGEIYVNWEDSEQGGDYDQDMWGTIHYTIDSSGITVTTDVSYQSTPYRMAFGYVVSGTTNDGFHVTSGINGFSYTDASISNSCSNCQTSDAATSAYYALGAGTAGVLEDPLWYTAKYGGFSDDGSHTITKTSQWDAKINSTGAAGTDGIPDNYFNSTNPGQLEANLSQVLAKITERVSSGTATAVIANSGTGTGMLVQALYQPEVTYTSNTKSQKVTWVGMMHALFVDSHGNLREDSTTSGTRGVLDDYATDKVVTIDYNSLTNQTEIQRYNTTDGVNLTPDGNPVPLKDLQPLWSARDQLAAIDNSAIPTQRQYDTQISATNGRYIFTAIDSNNDGVINNADRVAFTDTGIDTSNFGWLDIQTDFNGDGKIDVNDAHDLVNYIRGEDGIDNFRSRTIDYDGTGDKVWRLGDIVHSTPLIVGPPDSAWDSKYSDTSYTTFRNYYKHRRVMVYAGANDGMLHAFNGGFFISTATEKKYCTNPTCSTTSPVGDPLGSELWAYVPSNLLPHLQWLTEPNYPHVYYVDGTPQAFDVDIFPKNTTLNGMYHPDGWGTILVVGMRLGGGPITYTPETGRTVTSRSAYVIMDITDPEQPPVLLGEITAPALGFTTSTPSLIVKRAPGTDWSNPSVNNWYLVFGSGPTDLSTVTSTQDAKLYVLSLKLTNGLLPGGFVSNFNPKDLGIANSFVGDTNTIDWTNNYKTDAAYFGITGGGTGASPSVAPNGRLMRLVADGDTPTSWTTSDVIKPNPGQPFLNRPEFAQDEQGKWWVYAGTGRLFVPGDNKDNSQQSFYGIKEQVSTSTGLPTGTVTSSDLQNTTGVQVASDGSITDTKNVLPLTVTTFSDLESDISGKSGWYINFPTVATGSPGGSTRNLGPSTLFRQLELFTSYTPSADSCLAEGTSTLYALYYKTGTQYPGAGVTQTNCPTCSTSPASSIPLGTGLAREVTVLGTGTAFGGTSTGAVTQSGVTGVPTPGGRQSWREIIPQ